MKVLLLGATGQLATALRPQLAAAGHPTVGLTHEECDLADSGRVAQQLEAHRPDAVINTAAFHQVDRCEAEAEAAFRINSYAPRALAQHCERRGIRLVHVSTNYVFDGQRRTPYDEEAAPNPLSVYGLSKLAGEWFVRRECRRHVVVRTAGVYGPHGARQAGENFVERMITAAAHGGAGRPMRVVTDQIMTPTYAGHLARALVPLLAAADDGLFHLTNSGSCSWWEFARAILRRAGLPDQIEPVTSRDYGAAAPRPAYSVLASRRVSSDGLGAGLAAGLAPLPSWEEGLEAYFQERAQRRNGVRVEF